MATDSISSPESSLSPTISWKDQPIELSQDISEFHDTYNQYISELKDSRRFIMSPYDDFKLNPNDYILCLGNID